MTSPESRSNRPQPLRIQLRREDIGTLLGALAWVLGALQIMRDRGHAEHDEEFHDVYEQIQPKLDRLLEQVNIARRESMTKPEFEGQIEAAYAEVREAFEAWIQLTATDTLAIAAATRLEQVMEEAEEGKSEGE